MFPMVELIGVAGALFVSVQPVRPIEQSVAVASARRRIGRFMDILPLLKLNCSCIVSVMDVVWAGDSAFRFVVALEQEASAELETPRVLRVLELHECGVGDVGGGFQRAVV